MFDYMIKELSATEIKKLIDKSVELILLDVRSDEEFRESHIDKAINHDIEYLDKSIDKILADKNAKIIVYCRSGHRSEIATEMMTEWGYTDVINMTGGLIDWVEKKYKVVK